jgi:dienelactone hydrolase
VRAEEALIERFKPSIWPWTIATALAVVVAFQSSPGNGIPFRTTLIDSASGHVRFKSGDALPGGLIDGRPITPAIVDGELTLPSNCAAPFPAVVLLHGSLGLSQIQTDYARILRQNCYATFAVDSFTGRGVHSTVENQIAVTTESMVVDAYAALVLLQSHPLIDPKRIAVAGWSKGGTAVEHAMSNLVSRRLAPQAARFAAYVAFYPWCGEQTFAERKTGAPILFVLAKSDDWVSADACSDYAESLRKSGVDAHVRSFDAAHAFDNPELSATYFPDAIVSGNCRYEPRSNGFREIGSEVVHPWAEFDHYFADCSKFGAHTESDARAAREARKAMFDFLDAYVELLPIAEPH